MRTRSVRLALAMILLGSVASAQWVHTNGIYGGSVTVLAASGTDLYAGTGGFEIDGGVYRSTDNGENWIEVTKGLAHTWINAIGVSSGAAGDTSIFAGVLGGILRSTNNGTSWTEVDSGLTGTGVTSFAVNGTNIFTGLTYGGVFLSTDNGTSWIARNEGLKDQYGKTPLISALSFSGQNLIAGTDDGGGVFLSTNNGAGWKQADLTNTSVWCFAVSGTNLFAGTFDGVFRSTDNGTSWSNVNSGLKPCALASSPNETGGMNLYAGDCRDGGLSLSTDNGTSWTSIGLTDKKVRALAVRPNEEGRMSLFAGISLYGVFVSTNNGASWSERNNGLTHVNVLSLAYSPAVDANDGTNLFAGTMFNGIFRSVDNGISWTQVDSGLRYTGVYALVTSGQNLFAATGDGVYLSSNSGMSWSVAGSGLAGSEVRSLAASGSNLFAGTWRMGVVRSTNNGMSWTSCNSGLPPNTAVSCFAVSGTNLFAGTVDRSVGASSGIYLSTNNGTSWIPVNSGLTYVYGIPEVTSFAVIEANLFAGTREGGIFRSTDGGTSWAAVNTGLTNLWVTSLAVFGSTIFAGTYGGVFRSTKNGTGWTEVNTGLINTVLSLVVVSVGAGRGSLFAGTGGGVWRRSLSEFMTAVRSSADLPEYFSLEQNYPNPFNPTTIVGYQLPEPSHVRIAVCDLLGREVAVLVNEKREPGTHEVKFDGSGLSSGVYYCRMQAGDPATGSGRGFFQTRKLLFLK